uniref:Uncharacterized protein n=1 Tax=Anopheles darlingi TaxID=43151 RepID=A0A2M4DM11_ANODA
MFADSAALADTGVAAVAAAAAAVAVACLLNGVSTYSFASLSFSGRGAASVTGVVGTATAPALLLPFTGSG